MSTRLTHAERRGKKPWKYYLSMEKILARRKKTEMGDRTPYMNEPKSEKDEGGEK